MMKNLNRICPFEFAVGINDYHFIFFILGLTHLEIFRSEDFVNI